MWKWFKRFFQPPQPAGPPVSLKSFATSETTIARDCVSVEGDAWCVEVKSAQTVRLFELEDPDLEQCLVTYRASLRSEDLSGRAFLEMWCRFPGRGEFFSKGFQQSLTGTRDWASYEIPFWLKRGQRPDLIKLCVTLEGSGQLWLRDVQVTRTPFQD